MNIKSRLRKLELNNLNKIACFCGKTLVDLVYGKTDADSLTYCPNCRQQFDAWANLSAEAEILSENVADL